MCLQKVAADISDVFFGPMTDLRAHTQKSRLPTHYAWNIDLRLTVSIIWGLTSQSLKPCETKPQPQPAKSSPQHHHEERKAHLCGPLPAPGDQDLWGSVVTATRCPHLVPVKPKTHMIHWKLAECDTRCLPRVCNMRLIVGSWGSVSRVKDKECTQSF